MTQPLDFSVPCRLSDVALIVEGKKLHVNKSFLCMMSPFFEAMFTKPFSESNKDEVPLMGPPDSELKYEEFLEFLHVVHPPFERIKATTVEYLLELAHYFEIGFVFSRADDFMTYEDRNHRQIQLIKKLVMTDKYPEKLAKTNKLIKPEFRKISVVREVMRKPEYTTLSAETRAELLESVLAANKFMAEEWIIIICDECNSGRFYAVGFEEPKKGDRCMDCDAMFKI